jgi:hypothetical protein
MKPYSARKVAQECLTFTFFQIVKILQSCDFLLKNRLYIRSIVEKNRWLTRFSNLECAYLGIFKEDVEEELVIFGKR